MKKTDLKLLAIVTGGVLLAGLAMNQFADISVVAKARNGFAS